MQKLWILAFFAILLLPLNLLSRQNAQPLTNDDIVGMVKAGLAPEVVIAKIKSSRSSFDTSPAALEQLKKAGVPDSVILAMVQAPEQKVYVSCDYGTVGITEAADPNSRIVGKADCHTALTTVGGDTAKWARVRTQDGAVGFVLKAFLTSEKPAAAITEQAELPANELRALAWRGIPWATTSYYQQPGSSYTNCTGQGQWLGNIYQSNLSCTGSYTPAQSIPLTWQHYTIYNLVETSSAYLVLACTRNWRWSKCSYLIPGDVFSFEYKKGEIWISGERGGKGNEETLKYAIVLNRPKAGQ